MTRYFSLGLLLVCLCGCAHWISKNQLDEIEVVYNQGYRALAIDVVYAYSDSVGVMVGELSAEDWFSQRNGLLNQYANELNVSNLEVVPNTVVPLEVEVPRNAKAVFVFALDQRFDVSQFKAVRLTLDNGSATIVPLTD